MISIGFIIGIIVTPILIGACLWWSIFCHKEGEHGAAVWSYIVLIVVVGLAAWGFYPYDMQYHSYQVHSGKVSSIDKRLVASNKAMEDKFLVRFEGSEQQYGCTDTRCASVRPGDQLSLSCIRVWQYAGTDGYDCNYNQ